MGLRDSDLQLGITQGRKSRKGKVSSLENLVHPGLHSQVYLLNIPKNVLVEDLHVPCPQIAPSQDPSENDLPYRYIIMMIGEANFHKIRRKNRSEVEPIRDKMMGEEKDLCIPKCAGR